MTGSVFLSCTTVFRNLKLVKEKEKEKKKGKKHVYFFSLCFGNSHFCVQIKSSDYFDGVSAKLKYLNLHDYIFNPVLFIISLEGSHFGSRESMPVSNQLNQTSKEIEVDISIFLGSFI